MSRYDLEIYIPYMGCPCGPSSPEQDEEVQNFQETLATLKKNYKDEISYVIYALNLHLQQFKARPEVVEILQDKGREGLPVVFINNHPVFQGKFPTLENIEKHLAPHSSDNDQV